MAVNVYKINFKRQPTENMTTLFRKTLRDRQVNETQLNEAIKAYVLADRPEIHESELPTAINNISKELASNNMNWKVFRKGMMILGIEEITVLV